jgi:alkaline phosphatase
MHKNISIILIALLLTSTIAYSQKNKSRPRNIILMVGDGMGAAQIYAGLTANRGSLNLERCTHSGFHKNQAYDAYVTDSGAGATALSIGYKTINGAIGVDANKIPRTTILETAEQKKKSTGLVVTCSMTHATPASFVAHQPSRKMVEEIAADYLKTDIDVFIGGGRDHFAKRKDGRNLIDSLKARKYQIATTIEEVEKITSGKLAGFLADVEPLKISEGRGDQLLKSTQTAIKILNQNKNGFFMMVEGSQIDWGGHANDTQYIIDEMLDFDKAIGAVLDFAEKDGNTLVIITADHETGGFSIVNGDMTTGKVEGKFTTGNHTGVMIPVFAYGPGAEVFSGIYNNYQIFDKMMNAFGFEFEKVQ